MHISGLCSKHKHQLVGTELTRATVGLVGSALGWRGVAVECAFGSHGMQIQIQLICFWKDIYLRILGFVQLKYDEIMNIHESTSLLPGFLLFAL